MTANTALPVSGPALVAHAAGDLRIDDVALGTPAPDEAVIEVSYGGICGSDLHYWLHGAAGESILKAPLVLGHEISGFVVHPAANGTGPSKGTAVAVHPATPAPGKERYPAEISLAITRELQLLGSYRFNDEIDEVIAALSDGSLRIDPVITHTFPLERALEAFDVARNSAESGKVLLDFGSTASN